MRNQWRTMLTLIVIFILGYLGYTWAFWNSQTRTLDLIVPGVFFLGACFVWLTATLSLQTAVAVMHISPLEQENSTDALTGVFNRRYLDRRLNEEVTRAHRHGLPLSVLLLDIDHFKRHCCLFVPGPAVCSGISGNSARRHPVPQSADGRCEPGARSSARPFVWFR